MVDRYTGPELPALDKAQIHVLRGLLQLEEMHEFTQASLGLGLMEANWVASALGQLGWPLTCKPATRETPELYWTFNSGRDVAIARFESRFFKQWKEEAIEFLAGAPPRSRQVVVGSTAKLTGALSAPSEGTPAYRLLYLMLTLHEATPEISGIEPATFVASVRQLRNFGWPINLTVKPVTATWVPTVREPTIAAWFADLGELAQVKLAFGLADHDTPSQGTQKP